MRRLAPGRYEDAEGRFRVLRTGPWYGPRDGESEAWEVAWPDGRGGFELGDGWPRFRTKREAEAHALTPAEPMQ